MLSALLPVGAVAPAMATTGDLVITGVVDGPLTGGLPKAIELYAVNDIADLSVYGVGSANNGGGTDGEEFTFPADAASAGEFIYVASENTGFNEFLGFAPNYTSSAANINGDDAIELFMNGAVVDIFGEIDVDGTGQPWEHLDGWTYRVDGTGQDGSTFVLANWTFSGPNALDGETTNATAATPFPIGTYTSGPPPAPVIVINEVDADQFGTDAAEFVELYDGGVGNTPLDGLSIVLYNGSDDASYLAFDLDGMGTSATGYFVLCGDAANTANCDLDVSPDTNLIQNGADAVALVEGNAADFPNDTPVSIVGVLDALVYDTDDGDDPGLLVLLNPGQPQVNERGGGDGTGHSNQRCPDGSGGTLNTDTYAQFAPTPGAENTCPPPVGAVPKKIHEVQGPGLASPIVGTKVIVEGVVVGDFQGSDGFNGFHIQEEDADIDGDPSTSEGVFIYDPGFGVDVNLGDVVEVTGTVIEFYDLTEIGNLTSVVVKSSGASVTPATVTLPLAATDDLEKYEGMAVTFPQDLVISEYYNFDRYGQIVLTTSRQFQPTASFDPGSPEAADAAAAHALARITLDDGRSGQNPDPALHPAGGVFDLANRFRGGDLITNLNGVMDFAFETYKVQPTTGADYTVANPRPAAHDPVGGTLEVATFNVLNYFTTLDGSGSICGPNGDQGCRGADNAEEFTRQRTKIIAAMVEMDSDIVGVVEIENHPTDVALADLVSGLNAATAPGTYDFVPSGVVGPDVIKVGLIYKPGTVSLLGAHQILETPGFLDPNNLGDNKNRAALAQTFVENATGEAFTVAVNHLKSKGSSCGPGDDDPEAASCNLTRTLAAQVLADWLAGDPTGSGDSDILVIGDLNSYDKEDPIDALIAGADDTVGTGDDYTDLVRQFVGEDAYTFVFSGQWGYLDYVMANESLLPSVTGATIWHINADEPDILDYDTSWKQDAQDALYEPNAYRSSDHDPVIIGLSLDQAPPVVEAEFDRIWATRRIGRFVVDYSCVDDIDANPTCEGDINGISVDDGQRVFLIKARGSTWHRMIGSTLFIKDSSFLLTVVGTDASGNTATTTAEPMFRTGGWWHHFR